MANLFDIAEKMGIAPAPASAGEKKSNLTKRRPWLEEETIEEVEELKKIQTTPQSPIFRERLNIPRGELKKPISSLEKLDNQLSKIEIKTSHLLEKVDNASKTKSAQSHHKLSINSPQTSNKIKREASFYTYICMPPRKLPRKILDHVKANAWLENGDWYSRIDSYELSQMAEINAHQIGNTVRQLRNEGFFEIIEHSTSGYRLLKINPLIFGIK
jgi:hypothetical protein